MSETTAETWAVVDEAGAIHEVDVSEGRTGSPPWVAHVADGTARRSLTSARDAVVMMAQARGWSIVEVLAPGQVSRAGIERERDEARGLLDSVREALGPTCADATHEALPGLVAEVVACDAEMHREVDARGERLRETAAEVAHLEARRGALIAEVDRLTAARYVGGGNAEDWRALAVENGDEHSATLTELLAAREALAAARLDGAREMRERAAAVARRAEFCEGPGDIAEAIATLPVPEAPAPQPVAWGAMPTAAEVAARCEGREEPHRGAPWMRRHTDTSGDFVEVMYLRAIDGLMYFREPDGAVWYLMRAVHETSRWRPIDSDGVAVGGAQ